ncbi:hypothetical protein AHAS_Ahas11G0074100 [Arachis hypogaea]
MFCSGMIVVKRRSGLLLFVGDCGSLLWFHIQSSFAGTTHLNSLFGKTNLKISFPNNEYNYNSVFFHNYPYAKTMGADGGLVGLWEAVRQAKIYSTRTTYQIKQPYIPKVKFMRM